MKNKPIEQRVAGLDWREIETSLDRWGTAATGPLLTPEECDALTARYEDDEAFRSRIVMARHGFGQGEYRYFAYPLPEQVRRLREAMYPLLAPLANLWHETMGIDVRFPEELGEFLEHCHAAGQERPTPLLLRYREGDYNCLHQDLYGEHVFPLQLAVLLSAPGRDFEGGQFVVTEQRPRMQSRAEVVDLAKGCGAIFAVRHHPRQGARGPYRVTLRHGVSTVRKGERYTLGVIFHDAA